MKKQVIAALTFLAIVFALIFYDKISQAMVILAYVLIALLVISFLLMAMLIVWYVVERMKLLHAQRIEAEKQAHVMTVTVGNQVFVRDTDPQAIWRAMHLEARAYINSQSQEPSSLEEQRWQLFNMPQRVGNKLLTLPPPQTQVDLLAMLDRAQCALIVGQRDSGKTTILQHVINRRLGTTYVLVLDPHSHPTRWPQGCEVIGTERDFQKIENALKGLLALMNKRYRDIGKGLVREGEHRRVTVIIDEWRAIVHQLGKTAANIIKTLLAESRKTNIDVFVGTHSERVKALGIEGEGDLKEGFVLVRLAINKLTGERKATIDYGDGEMPATLPGAFRGNIATNSKELDSDDFISLEPEPTPAEAHILHLHRQGESYRTISQAVWGEGKFGNFYNRKIEQIIQKYGEK